MIILVGGVIATLALCATIVLAFFLKGAGMSTQLATAISTIIASTTGGVIAILHAIASIKNSGSKTGNGNTNGNGNGDSTNS